MTSLQFPSRALAILTALACSGLVSTAAAQSGARASGAVAQNFGTTSQSLINQSVGFNYTSDAIRQSTFSGIGGRGNGVANGGAAISKPFANASRGPTVSPYLGLFNTGIIGDEIDSYQTIVRPQLQQQQLNNQFRQQASQINRQIQAQSQAAANQALLQQQQLNAQFQQMVGRAAFNPRGSEQVMPTGHPTSYGYTGRFYPGRR